jgi:RNA polymerase sigma-70 factor (ECF subfamily)
VLAISSGKRPPEGPDDAGHAQAAADLADRAVVARVLDGDRDAFAEIVARHGRGIHRLAYRLLRDQALAEEVAQEALARAYTGLGSFRGEGALRPWLYRITANLCRDVMKRADRREHASADPTLDGTASPIGGSPFGRLRETEVDRRRALVALEAAIARLPDGQREAFVLRLIENLPYEEMEAATGVAVGALKVRVHRARERLKLELGELLDGIVEESPT